MIKVIHLFAGAMTLFTVTIFWLSTLISELFASQETVIVVKSLIPWGFFILIPALIITGISGFVLAKGRKSGLIGKKLKRMPFIAANGIIILIPAALFLAYKARNNEFDLLFHSVQILELMAGAINIGLLSLNIRDGLRIKKHTASK